ncbi:MAG: YicC family protein [Isosphaeraceae bacterium]|jgi:uncharacterized protein (TIGR00255 family)|nr:MAG: YicC family protein [Isosphaeraceae bacterium]
MLLSMTGFGDAHYQDDRLTVAAEVRSVNNRHLKLTCRISAAYEALEPDLERLVREAARRGSVQLWVHVERPRRPDDYRLNLVALAAYRDQLETLRQPGASTLDPVALLGLPGVVEERRDLVADPHEDWPVLETTVRRALDAFQASRAREGRAMAEELLRLGDTFARRLEEVAARAPAVVADYHQRLLERVQALVKDRLTIEPRDLIREVALFADRADIAEELTRLRAHLQQYRAVIEGPDSAGRKLEFLVQEMGRETNTIGSKANDVTISHAIVDMKGLLERIRELIQNVE